VTWQGLAELEHTYPTSLPMGIEQQTFLWHLPPGGALFAQLPVVSAIARCRDGRLLKFNQASAIGRFPLSMVEHVSG
jgi:hypothetical protein